MGADLCGCGCGEPVKPGKRYVFAHYARTQRAAGSTPPDAAPVPCACGCGVFALPGNRYLFGHHARTRRVQSLPRTPCQCGCGEIASPGKRFMQGHQTRTRGSAKTPGVCQCGCGGSTTPGKRFILKHHNRAVRGTSKRPGSTPCPRCGRSVNLRDDGTLGLHWASKGKVGERYRCPAGGVAAPPRRPRPGRRVSVTIDVSLPEGWDVARFRAAATQALRVIDEPFVVNVDVAVLDEVAS